MLESDVEGLEKLSWRIGSGGDIKLDCMSMGFLRMGCDMVVETIALIEVGGYGGSCLMGEFAG